MRNDLQMQLIGDHHEQRSIATVEPPEINVRHSLSPIEARRVEIFSAGGVRPRNRMIVDPKDRRGDTSIVELAKDWQWSSGDARFQRAHERRWLAIADDPALPRNWRAWLNKAETEAELNSLRPSVKRGLPFGDDNWTRSSALRTWSRNHNTAKRTAPKRDPPPFLLCMSRNE
jgi:hypothetical protein